MIKFKQILNLKHIRLGLLLTLVGLMSGCAESYKSLTINVENGQFIARGVIDETTPEIVSQAIAMHPSIKVLVLEGVPGSIDDESNLIAARILREAEINTVVPVNGVVASGGTDLFLAGKERKIAYGACVGVHTWAAPSLTGYKAGSDFPKDDIQHQLYLSYYEEMGIPAEFYWFTLDAAPVEDVYFMTPHEMNKFKMSTTFLKSENQESVEQKYQRCLERLIASDA